VLDEFINRGINYVEFTCAVDLLMDDKNQVAGAVLFDLDSEEYKVRGRSRLYSQLVASGDYTSKAFATTNHYERLETV